MNLSLGFRAGEVYAGVLENALRSGSAEHNRCKAETESLLKKIHRSKPDRVGLRSPVSITDREAGAFQHAMGDYFEDYYWSPQESSKAAEPGTVPVFYPGKEKSWEMGSR